MRINNCCREIRLQAFCSLLKRGDMLSGLNTNNGEMEKVIVVKVFKNDNETVVTPYTEKALKKYNKRK